MIPATQLMVPISRPEAPIEVFHVTEVTPTLSAANPWSEMELADVAMMLDPG